jgi:hypothetical protein
MVRRLQPIYPEKLLIQRYQLQSELWGLGQEIQRIELEAQPLLQKLKAFAPWLEPCKESETGIHRISTSSPEGAP